MGLFDKILIFAIIFSTISQLHADFNVLDFGATGDGKKDDKDAFTKAWDAACQATTTSTLAVPKEKTFLLSPITFNGPCNAPTINFQLLGTVVAPDKPEAWKGLDQGKWITFQGVDGLTVNGEGTLDGKGKGWWDQSCKHNPGAQECTKLAPTSLSFLSVKNCNLREIQMVNSPQSHILLMDVNVFNIDHINVNSPGDSPNTDGVHLHKAQHVTITNSNFHCGDDCISVGDYCSDIKANTIDCGPGHGISIGSLGLSGNSVQVENIHVENANIHGTTNGVRIKTYQAGKGYARGLSFKNINFVAVQYPIIIDQYYCTEGSADSCKSEKTGVHISDITFDGLTGTSDTPIAINLNCSQVVACTELKFNEIKLKSAKSEEVTSICINAHGTLTGTIEPSIPCLQK